MMRIPIMDLKAQYRPLGRKIDKAIKKILGKQAFILGEDLRILEERIASFCNVRYAVGLNSGTDALILAMEAIGIGRGDEVITSPFTFIATAEAIVRVGARPVFVDINAQTYNINPFLIEEKITKKTKAILPVHLYGLCADMDPILKIAKRHRLKIIEDCAQAIGSEYKGKAAGSMGDAGAISFYPGKNLGCFGDGGMVVTNNKLIYDKVKCLRNHGSSRQYYHNAVGYNSRLDNLQAAILNAKLNHLNGWIERRIKNAEFYNEHLRAYYLSVPCVPKGLKHSFHHYVLRTKHRNALVDYLNKNGIEARVYYPLPLHLQRCFKFLGYRVGDFPEAEALSRENFAIPVYPELTDPQKIYIVKRIKQFFNNFTKR